MNPSTQIIVSWTDRCQWTKTISPAPSSWASSRRLVVSSRDAFPARLKHFPLKHEWKTAKWKWTGAKRLRLKLLTQNHNKLCNTSWQVFQLINGPSSCYLSVHFQGHKSSLKDTPSGAVGCSLSWEPAKFSLYYCHDLGFKSSRYNNFSYQSFIYSPTDATILKFTLKQIRHVSVLQVNTIIRERIHLCLLHKLACWVSIILHIRAVQRLDIIRVLFIHQLMHQWVVLVAFYIYVYIYSTNIGTEYFKHGIHSPFFFLFKMQFVS